MLRSPLSCRTERSPAAFRSVVALALTSLLPSTLDAQYESFWQTFNIKKDARVSLIYDSNIGNRQSGLSDTIATGTVTASIDRQFRYFTLGGEIYGVVARYFDYDQLNYENLTFNWIIDASEQFGTGRLQYSVDFDFNQDTRSTSEVQGQVTERTITGGGRMTYLVSRRLSVGGGIKYTQRDPQGKVIQVDPTVGTNRPSVFRTSSIVYSGWLGWQQSDALQYRLTASHSQTLEARDEQDGYTNRVLASINGQLTPKLSGSVSAGLNQRHLDIGSNTTVPSLGAALNWKIDSVSSARLSAQQEFGSSINGSNSNSYRFELNYDRKVSRRVNFDCGTSLIVTKYERPAQDPTTDPLFGTSRSEATNTIYNIYAGASYQLTTWAVGRLQARWSTTQSDFTSGDAERLRVSGSVSMAF